MQRTASVVCGALVLLVTSGQLEAGETTWTLTNSDIVSLNFYHTTGTYYGSSPYPSTIHVPALPGVIQDISVTLRDVYSTRSTDINVRLTAPWSTYYKGGVSLMVNVGGDGQIGTGTSTSPDLTVTDSAANSMSYTTPPATGTYKPTSYYGNFAFPSPCPNLQYYQSFEAAGVLDQMFPVGNWNLWCYDDYPATSRAFLLGGWSITLTMRYSGITIPAGSLVAVQNEIAKGLPGHTSGVLATTTGGIFATDFYQGTSASLLQRIDAGLAPFDSIPSLGTSDVQYWNVFHDGQMTGQAELTFEYDPATLQAGLDESDLGIWHFADGAWAFLGGVVDADQNTITVTTDSFSPFMVGAVPEPATMGLLGLGLAGLIARRRKERV